MLHFGPIRSFVPRNYRRASESYRRLIGYIVDYQKKTGVAPSSFRQIGRATGLSHSQVKRLLVRAEESGLLRRRNPCALSYEAIFSPPTPQGVVWLPLVEVHWHKPIDWQSDLARGVWLDRAVYGIRGTEKGLWALTFPEAPNTGQRAPLRLDEFSLALVRKFEVPELRRELRGHPLLVETNGQVSVLILQKLTTTGGLFAPPPPDLQSINVASRKIRSLAQILMTTIRPAMPRGPSPR